MRKAESNHGELYGLLPNTGIPELRLPASSGALIGILLTSMFHSICQKKTGRSYPAGAEKKFASQPIFAEFVG